MALSNMVVFNEYIKESTIETVFQEIQKFNAASNGAIVLSADGFDGDFLERSLYGSIMSARRRVDRYGTNSTVANTPMSEIKDVGVKVAGGFGPISYEPSQWTWMRQNESKAIAAISKSLSDAILQDQLNASILAGVAAVGNNADAVLDGTSGALGHSILNTGDALFGDASGVLAARVMSGASYHKLVGENIANASTLFVAGNVTVVDILGKPAIVTDAPALTAGAVGNILTLAQAGIVVNNASDIITDMGTIRGNERILTTFQADYAFGINLLGYAWDIANGGKSPDDTEIGTGTNWDVIAGNVKGTAGTLVMYDATA